MKPLHAIQSNSRHIYRVPKKINSNVMLDNVKVLGKGTCINLKKKKKDKLHSLISWSSQCHSPFHLLPHPTELIKFKFPIHQGGVSSLPGMLS